MLKHQINLLPNTEDDLVGQEHRSVSGFRWWAVPSERGWLLINANFGYVALVPDGEETLINRVGRTAIETVQSLATGERAEISFSICDAFEDIHWRVTGEMPDYISGLIARVIQRARESKDPFWFEKAVKRMNKTERVTYPARRSFQRRCSSPSWKRSKAALRITSRTRAYSHGCGT